MCIILYINVDDGDDGLLFSAADYAADIRARTLLRYAGRAAPRGRLPVKQG